AFLNAGPTIDVILPFRGFKYLAINLLDTSPNNCLPNPVKKFPLNKSGCKVAASLFVTNDPSACVIFCSWTILKYLPLYADLKILLSADCLCSIKLKILP